MSMFIELGTRTKTSMWPVRYSVVFGKQSLTYSNVMQIHLRQSIVAHKSPCNPQYP